MGSIINFLCEGCGYSKDNIIVGCGMIAPKPEYDIAPCYTCGKVRRIDISKMSFYCNKCKTNLEPFDDELDSHKCPKCKKMTLRIFSGGIWD